MLKQSVAIRFYEVCMLTGRIGIDLILLHPGYITSVRYVYVVCKHSASSDISVPALVVPAFKQEELIFIIGQEHV